MNTRSTALFPLLLLAFLAAGTYWLDYVVGLSAPGGKGPLRHDPDFTVENFTITAMTPEGRPESRLSAERMLHFPDDRTTDVTALRLTQISRDGRPPLHVQADRATLSENAEELDLYDNVVVVRAATKDRDELRLETPYLHYSRESEIARTPSPVVFTEGESRVEGVGMEMNGKTRWFELKSAVRATFARPAEGK